MASQLPTSEPVPFWSELLEQIPSDSSVRDVIAESWSRCRTAALDPHRVCLRRVGDDELAFRSAASRELLEAVRPYLEWVSALLANEPHVVYVTDADGVVLLSTGTDRVLLESAGLEPGYDWSERAMGTNGAGTALATGTPQAVVGAEHFVEAYHGCACTAAPIRGPDGEIRGAIDISTASLEGVPRRMLLVTHAARVVERDLALSRSIAVAERRAAEAEDAKATLDALLEHIPEGITIAAAPDVRILRVSRHGQELTGRPEEQLAIPASDAAHSTAWGLFRPDGTPCSDADLPLTRAIRLGEISTDEEWLIRRPDGTTLTILTNAGPIRDASGAVTGGVIAWRDVSERKAAEEQLRESRARMQALYEAAEEAARQREDVLAVVSHDLRNPLNAIMTAASLLVEVELPEEKRARQVGVISRAARTMLRLIEDLLDATRIQAGSFRIERESFDPARLLDEIAAAMEPLLETKGLTLDVRVQDVALMDGDRTRLLQVLDNLLGNAIRHSPDGGRIGITVERRDESVVISVSDDGPGVRESDRAHLFEKFWQGEGRATGGAGLGLPICRGIVEAHGGEIWLDTEAEPGTTIRFSIPPVRSEASRA